MSQQRSKFGYIFINKVHSQSILENMSIIKVGPPILYSPMKKIYKDSALKIRIFDPKYQKHFSDHFIYSNLLTAQSPLKCSEVTLIQAQNSLQQAEFCCVYRNGKRDIKTYFFCIFHFKNAMFPFQLLGEKSFFLSISLTRILYKKLCIYNN